MFVYYVDEIIVYGVIKGFAYSASLTPPCVPQRATAGPTTSNVMPITVPGTRKLRLKNISDEYSQGTSRLRQTETLCYTSDVLETLPQDSNLTPKYSSGARVGAFPFSKSILNKYIKYLSFTLNSSSGTIVSKTTENLGKSSTRRSPEREC